MKKMSFLALAAGSTSMRAFGGMTANERRLGRFLRDGNGHPAGTESAAEMATKIKAQFDDAMNKVKAVAEDALGKAKAGEALTTGFRTEIDETIVNVNALKEQIDALEQKAARGGGSEAQDFKSAGQLFSGAENVKSFLGSPRGGSRVEVEMPQKAIISSLTTVADGSAGDLIVPMRAPMVDPLQRRMTIRDLLMPGRTSQPSIQYPKETGFTNNAATVSETSGATKPQSEIQFDIVNTAVTTIAHWVLATRQIMDDVPMLESYIDGRLRYGLALKEEQQLLNGSGAGTDLNGIYTQATAFAAGPNIVATPQKMDVIRYAMLQGFLAELAASGIVLNPNDWANIETLKDTSGFYLIGDPINGIAPRLWGLPVVATQAMTAGTFLTGAFNMGAQIFDRMDAIVALSTEDSDNFRKNLVTILAEERLALAVYRPEAFIKGTFSAAITDLTS